MRRLLVISSQCEALKTLSFLPERGRDLRRVLADPRLGACEPMPGIASEPSESAGLLENPSLAQAKGAIRAALKYCSAAGDALVLAWIGHGQHAGDNYYLLPLDADAQCPTSDFALRIIDFIQEELQGNGGGFGGLILLLDACSSGVAVNASAQAWLNHLGNRLDFQVLAATDDREAFDGSFSFALVQILEDGLPDLGADELLPAHLIHDIQHQCSRQSPTWLGAKGGMPSESLWLARNAANHRAWSRTEVAEEIRRLTHNYQQSTTLEHVVGLLSRERHLLLEGLAGTGKSGIAAALAGRPPSVASIVPRDFVQAIALLNAASTPQRLADQLRKQLQRSVAGFDDAAARALQGIGVENLKRMPPLERHVVRPLAALAPGGTRPIRIVLDSLDSVPDTAASEIVARLEELMKLPWISLVVTSRSGAANLPSSVTRVGVESASSQEVLAYLRARSIDDSAALAIASAAVGNWLVVTTFANVHAERQARCEEAPLDYGRVSLGDAFNEPIGNASAGADGITKSLLFILAAAGSGPVLPASVLRRAAGWPDGPGGTDLLEPLAHLKGLVAQSDLSALPSAAHLGVFHQELVTHLLALDPDAMAAAHRSIVAALEALVPGGPTAAIDDRRYALAREMNHRWQAGLREGLPSRLSRIASEIPRQSLDAWNDLLATIQSLGTDHPDVLTARHNIASWTGRNGDSKGALALSQALLPDRKRALGYDHPDVLTTRNNIAAWTGENGDAKEALALFQALLLDRKRVLGCNHPDVLNTRSNIASWTGRNGDIKEALALFQALLPDQERVLGRSHPDTLATRNNKAGWTGKNGDTKGALALFQALLPDQERVLSRNHPDVLTTRNNIAAWTGENGDTQAALALFQALLPDRKHVLGCNHPDVLATRSNIAAWTGENGDTKGALALFQALLPDRKRVLGCDHPDTLATRSNIAFWTGENGDTQEALALFQALLPDLEQVLGCYHPDVLRTRNNIAAWTAENGDTKGAMELFQALLPDQKRVLGSNHPDVLNTRGNIAALAGRDD